MSRNTSLFLLALSLLSTIAVAHAHDGVHPPKVEKTGQAIKSSEFTTLDSNKDGNLSKAELAKHKLGPHFDMLDTDKDGRLSIAEFAAGKGM